MTKQVCIVGGGATGAGLLWCLAQDAGASANWTATLLHEDSELGGHSYTLPVQHNGKMLPIDIGVQLICPLMYPNVDLMLQTKDFATVRRTPFDLLKVACAFPRDPRTGDQRNWGNFPAYQSSTDPRFQILSPTMADDCQRFEQFMRYLSYAFLNVSLADYLRWNISNFAQVEWFVPHFIEPYMSIMNGYGASLLDQMTFKDLAPLFGGFQPLASLTEPGVGWQRFTDGSASWVRAMVTVAHAAMQTDVRLGAKVSAVWTESTGGHRVHVRWSESGQQMEGTFDKVVLTTDMWTNHELLDNSDNQALWNALYRYYVHKDLWSLLPGKCYVHTDRDILSPDLRDELETLQFTAYYAPLPNPPYYELRRTFTTYIQKNLLNDAAGDGLYVTMYGDEPTNDWHVPDPSKTVRAISWRHGMWVPSFMDGPKRSLHRAQGLGAIPYQGQMDTNVYFAGNNTTMDSEEGALVSAMVIAQYAFNVPYPLLPMPHATAIALFGLMYQVMFPLLDTQRIELLNTGTIT